MSDGVWEDVVEMNKLCAKPTPRVGERWRVTIEGEVTVVRCASTNGLAWAMLTRPDGRSDEAFIEGNTWERLPDPEPEWQPGDLVLDAEGRLLEFERDETCVYDRWRVVRTGGVVRDDRAPRPLRRLVPES